MHTTDTAAPYRHSPRTAQVLRRFFAMNRRHTGILGLTIVFSLLTSVSLGVMTQCFQALVDGFGVTGSLWNRQTAILLGTLAILIPSQYLQQYLGIRYSEQCGHTMRCETFGIVSRIDMQTLDTQRVGDILSRVNHDMDQINGSLQNYFAVMLPQEIIGVFALAVSLVMNWQLTLFSLAVVPVFMALQMKITAPLTRLVRQRQQAAGESLAIANHLMDGCETARAYNMGAALQRRYDAAIGRSTANGMEANRATILLTPFSRLLFFLPQLGICGFGVYLAGMGRITSGEILSVLILSGFIRTPIADFASVLSSFKTARGCAARVFELWDMPAESIGGAQTAPRGSTIELTDVTFAYPDQPPVLRGLTLRIAQGEHVALVGASGCGKSTALKLLMGLYRRQAGDITVFGHPVDAWAADALRGQIACVGQEPWLFAGSIWDNVAIGRQGAAAAEIQAAIDAALLGNLDVRREIGERGIRLSGGQRQRIAIARAMLKDAPLLLLDEPTSALDTQSEALVARALAHLTRGRTTITVAHRLSALRNIDRIFCMQDGRIAESGTHGQLMAAHGIYYRLYRSQEENDRESDD